MSKPPVELQINTESVVRDFLAFYYNAWNTHDFSSLGTMYRDWSEVMANGTVYKGSDIQTLFHMISKQNPQYQIDHMDFLLCGARRVNIVVTGKIQIDTSVSNFTEYIHLGSLKSKYWIQSSILRSSS